MMLRTVLRFLLVAAVNGFVVFRRDNVQALWCDDDGTGSQTDKSRVEKGLVDVVGGADIGTQCDLC